ncbi:MAG TPA: hypothetical protein VFB78_05795 [Acidimicrobiales bacterium]|nr:hypothetical protein [Acidimicrobiales bacterium]
MTDRFVVLGLAGPRPLWFSAIGQWANAGLVPIDFIKCVSSEQVHTRLASGRVHSAVILDGALPSVDRDLIEVAHDDGAAVFVVDTEGRQSHWVGLGADVVLVDGFSPDALIGGLRAHAAMVPTGEWRPAAASAPEGAERGALIAVCGPGGTGVSTLAIALAQQLAADRRQRHGSVVLADLCLRAEQAMLHDAGDIGPGVQELVDQCRTSTPDIDQVRDHTYAVTERGYALLLGLRRPAAWSALRPRAIATALDGLRVAYGTVVCDCDGDVEGQADGGSADVEERHALTRAAVTTATAVFVVGGDRLKGTYSLARLTNELVGAGVDPARVVPVFNHANRGSRGRTRITRAFVALLSNDAGNVLSPIFVADRDVEDALHDRGRLPAALGDPLVAALSEVMSAAVAPAATRPGRRLARGEVVAFPQDVAAS